MASKNPLIKKAGEVSDLTEAQVIEYTKCFNDPLYFIEHYIYVSHPVRGQTLFVMYDYQRELINAYHNNKDVIVKWSRQSGKSESSCAYLFWFSIFRKDKTILIASNKHKNSRAMITRIKYMYEHLPMWLKPGVKDDGWNALSLKFDNGCRIESDATSETTGRGGSFSILYLDEVGFVPPRVQELMWASISPTLATGGKLFITSTPNGDSDLFATLWRGAEGGTNGFVYHAINWDDVTGRDEAFKQREIAKNGLLTWRQEFECCRGDTEVTVADSTGDVYSISIAELRWRLKYLA